MKENRNTKQNMTENSRSGSWSFCEGLLRGSNSVHLPLGVAGSAAVLICFCVARAMAMLLMAVCRQGHAGFPFLFETLLVFPFSMQCVFYSTQTFIQFGFKQGFTHIRNGLTHIVPCLVYSVCMSSSPLMETYAMQYITPSMCVVLKQLVLVNVAVGEVLAFGEHPSRMAWILIFAMCCFVGLFQQLSSTGASATEQGNIIKGIVPMLGSTVIGGAGGILQQKFMQRQAQNVPLPVKLLYQHIIAISIVPILISCNPESRHRIMTEGFFSGWNSWAYLSSACMWLWFLGASMVTACISAMAGCFAAAVSIVITGILEVVFLGHHMSFVQLALMMCICITAVVYTQVRLADKAQNKEPEKGKYRPKLKVGKREVERRGDSDSD